MDSTDSKWRRKFRCFSPNCKGKEVSEASFYRHKRKRNSLEDLNGSNQGVGQEVVRCNEWLDDDLVIAEENKGEESNVFDFGDGKIPAPSSRDFTLELAMRTQMVLLQSDMDSAKVPVDFQDRIMRRIFSRKSTDHFDSMSIGQLFTYAGN